ncbi:MAG: M10 family metallopeptidase [Pseudomonadota bacterium]|nr:M10 family metallopeptidase [Pseudomonadota bacterium]
MPIRFNNSIFQSWMGNLSGGNRTVDAVEPVQSRNLTPVVEVGQTIGTSYDILVGDTVNSTIALGGDQDWYAVELTAGQCIQVDLGNGTLLDSYIVIYDSTGTVIAEDDDAGTGYWASTTYYAETDQTIYIAASGYDGDQSGTYQLTVEEISLTDIDLLATLDWGTSLSSNTITVYFAPSGYTADGFTSEGVNSYERQQFLESLELISQVADVTFVVTTNANAADFRIILDTNEAGGSFYGYFNPPGETNEGVGVFNGALWDRTAGGDLELGGYGFVTITHEVLHGMGMAHPHDNGGTSTIMTNVTSPFNSYGLFDLNQGIYTTMSYNTGFPTEGNPSTYDYGYEFGPMALDIAQLQATYGANMTHATGDNTYTLVSVNATGTGYQAIWDAGGTDEIVYSGSASVTIDLRAATLVAGPGAGGFVSSADGIYGGFTIANGVIIENATGGSNDDILIGNDADNMFTGGYGDDVVEGGLGDDTFVVAVARADATVTETADGYQLVSSFGTDSLTSVEFISFSDGTVTIEDAATGGSGGGTGAQPTGLGRIFASQNSLFQGFLSIDTFSFVRSSQTTTSPTTTTGLFAGVSVTARTSYVTDGDDVPDTAYISHDWIESDAVFDFL